MPSMKKLLALAVLAPLAACGRGDLDDPVYEPRDIQNPYEGKIAIGTPDSADVEFMAFCPEELRALTGWVSRSEAESAVDQHEGKAKEQKVLEDRIFGHNSYVLWRQKTPADPAAGVTRLPRP
jgi:hypothetical protein